MNTIITRFAPSPTGNLHIGSVRTALINYIFVQQAKKKFPNSKFLLRIEDTDKKRSNNEFVDNILNGLKWLKINYDNEIYIQSKKLNRHQEIAFNLLKDKKAFKCICSVELLEKRRVEIRENKINLKRLCQSCEENEEVQELKEGFAIRIKIPNTGEIEINDLIQGNIIVKNEELDNFILLRNDGSPTYMLSVVVDDFDMGVNMIIRGDDHLNNAFRQFYIYKNMDWGLPKYAHIPLIHGEDGKKLSKRHGAVSIKDFKENGYLKESIINNLILLGWAPPTTNEILKIDEIIELYDLKKISKSSSIFSYNKLNFFNNHFIKNDEKMNKLFNYSKENKLLQKHINEEKEKFIKIFNVYKKNLNFYKNLESICDIYFEKNYTTLKNVLFDDTFNNLIKDFCIVVENIKEWEINILDNEIKKFINEKNIKFISFGKPLRLILINKSNGPSINEILFILDKKNTILRIKNYIKGI